MATVHVNPGICGFPTVVEATADEEMQVKVTLQSDCPGVMSMGPLLQGLDGYEEALGKWGTSTIFRVAGLHCTHAACPVPTAILKAVEVACGLALPAPVSMEINKH